MKFYKDKSEIKEEKGKFYLDIKAYFYFEINTLLIFIFYLISTSLKDVETKRMSFLIYGILFLIMSIIFIFIDVKTKRMKDTLGTKGKNIWLFLEILISLLNFLLFFYYPI